MARLQTDYTLKVKGGCKLRGKAAEVRWFGLVLFEIWKRRHNAELRVHRLILRCLECSVRMEMILEEHVNDVVLPGIYFLTESFCHRSVLLSMVACLYLSIYNGFCLILSLSLYIYSRLRFDLFFIYQSLAFYIYSGIIFAYMIKPIQTMPPQS